MNNKKIYAILLILLAILFIVGIIYFLFFYGKTKDNSLVQTEEGKKTSNIVGELKSIKKVVKKIVQKESKEGVVVDEEIDKSNLEKKASSFAERFGSYSNQSNYENISSLKVFMSKKMKIWADKFIKEAREKEEDSSVYNGVRTKALISEMINFDKAKGEAKILVKTQKVKTNGESGNPVSKQEDILIIFIKENGVWKVDGAFWQ